MLVMQALQVLQSPRRVREKFGPLRRVTSLRGTALMSHESSCREQRSHRCCSMSNLLSGDLEGIPSHILGAPSLNFGRRMTLKSVNACHASVTGAAKSLTGQREVWAPQEGHILTWHSFDES